MGSSTSLLMRNMTRLQTPGALAPMPRGLNHVGATGLGGKIYCIGGFIEQNRTAAPDVSVYDLLDVYNPATNSWSSLKPMPTARSGSAVALLDGKIFVFGGERLGGTFHQAEAYDPITDVWAELAPMPMSVHGTGAVTIGETIYIPAGGTLNGGTAQTNGIQSFTLK
jgi:N-acetylneuraminic acid mutarotase